MRVVLGAGLYPQLSNLLIFVHVGGQTAMHFRENSGSQIPRINEPCGNIHHCP